ncbi:nucleotidyl transferase AbiEii/AbiGii toxin family protein [Pseudothauera nasutitermitis]|uniref:Nucleotidyl transferase AbiEii/AbiGii toxin family protein n=1 Tax=Pseudothauera nasutitermitis TaxID=2565930 RepID=A0A4S4AN94_9RHOO|nr:nucleotidyl transferase AbiEii/AbiGii toxin family protein [Pseudothauera nasutitermitis]THF61093.1 nucleotidyl transferase AbiEii/AbiGii toxin family protein [Pseudothauera nasutitermitis]
MAEPFLSLGREDRLEGLEAARSLTGRPAHLLEKDIWVVWAISALFESGLGTKLVLKGGTSLSKAFKVIDRYSDSINIAYDVGMITGGIEAHCNYLPSQRSDAHRLVETINERLPEWIESNIVPVLVSALARDSLAGQLEIVGKHREKLRLTYPAVGQGATYAVPAVLLEFNARLASDPYQIMPISCEIDEQIPGISFPHANPRVAGASQAFWDKAIVAHAYCKHGQLQDDRLVRHWYDLAALARSEFLAPSIKDRHAALSAIRRMALRNGEDSPGTSVDYVDAVGGHLQIVPEGQALSALATDYLAMAEDQLLIDDAPGFEALMQACRQVEALANKAALQASHDIPTRKPSLAPHGRRAARRSPG